MFSLIRYRYIYILKLENVWIDNQSTNLNVCAQKVWVKEHRNTWTDPALSVSHENVSSEKDYVLRDNHDAYISESRKRYPETEEHRKSPYNTLQRDLERAQPLSQRSEWNWDEIYSASEICCAR